MYNGYMMIFYLCINISSNFIFLYTLIYLLKFYFILFLSISNHISFIKWILTNGIPILIIFKIPPVTLLKIFKCAHDHRSLVATVLKIPNLLCFNHHHSLPATILNILDLLCFNHHQPTSLANIRIQWVRTTF
jgi:hypothetical protein